MVKIGKVSVEYTLMQKAPFVYASGHDLGARVIKTITNELYPYLIDTEDVRLLIMNKLAGLVKQDIACYQKQNGVLLIDDEDNEVKTIELLSRLYDKVSALEKENEELRFLLKSTKTESQTV